MSTGAIGEQVMPPAAQPLPPLLSGMDPSTGEVLPAAIQENDKWPAEKNPPIAAIPAGEVIGAQPKIKEVAQGASRKWNKWDETRGIPADQFRQTAKETLSKLASATGKASLASPNAVDLLALTAANETQVGRYMKAPGTSKQRGVMQITDDTIEDLYRYMKRDPELLKAVDSLRNPDVPITRDVESNLPLSLALARVKYMMDKAAIPSDLAAKAKYYKRVYNSYDPKAKATPKRAIENYKRYF